MLDSRCTAVVTAALVGALGGAGARPMSPLGITRAQAAALAKTPGELVNTTLALDRGHLVYGIEIQATPDTVTHVEVDAGSGKVLHVTRGQRRWPSPEEVEAP